jgi:hypothetical protein
MTTMTEDQKATWAKTLRLARSKGLTVRPMNRNGRYQIRPCGSIGIKARPLYTPENGFTRRQAERLVRSW